IVTRNRCRRRRTCRRVAPLSRDASDAPTTTNAAFDSRARPVSRTAMAREIGGAESRTTSENAALRSSTSAHHAARDGSGGLTMHTPVTPDKCAQSRAASVRDASMYATQSPRSTAAFTISRTSVSLPDVPTTSVNRPRGSPPTASAASNAAMPVDNPESAGSGAGSAARNACSVAAVLMAASGIAGTRNFSAAATAVISGKRLQKRDRHPKKDRKHGTGTKARQRLLRARYFHSLSTHHYIRVRTAADTSPLTPPPRRPARPRRGRTQLHTG